MATQDTLFMQHEINHSNQWASLGILFVPIWTSGLTLSWATGHMGPGGGGCWNPLEILAGFEGTGYAKGCS